MTENEIRVVQTGGAGAKTAGIYQNYFNKRFEFYGRKLNIIQVESGDDTCASQKAAAVEVDAVEAFAVIDSANDNKACFHQELARRGVVSTTTNILFSEVELAELHPFMWQYMMGHEQLFGAIGEMFCARLAGAPAVHAHASSGESGAMCFVDGGDRRRPGQWPRSPDPFFRPPCDADAGPA